MQLATSQAYDLLGRHGVFALECCDKCGQILGAVRFTRKDDSGVWCSPRCRGDEAQQVIRRGGRPRKYKTPEQCRAAKTQQQREYRQVATWKKPPRIFTETKDLQAQKSALSHTPLGEATSSAGAA